jgi:membrane fusion protein, multidrug efflux system
MTNKCVAASGQARRLSPHKKIQNNRGWPETRPHNPGLTTFRSGEVSSPLAITLLLLSLTACGKEAAKPPERPPAPVETIAAPRRDVTLAHIELATLAATETVEIASEVAGRIVALPYDLGDAVEIGREVARLDADIAAAQTLQTDERRRQAEIAVAAARTNLRRVTRLHNEGVASLQDFEDARDRLALAEADLGAARAMLATTRATASKYSLSSPLSGVVTWRNAERGEMVAPGTPLLRIEPIDTLRAEVNLPEMIAARVHAGDSVIVESGGESVAATIFRVSPAVDRATRTVLVEVDVPNSGRKLRPGAFGRVHFALETRPGVIALPVPAVRREVSGGAFVLIAEKSDTGHVARRRDVTLGLEAGGWVEIASGLREGEEVVTLGASSLSDGAKIAPKRADGAAPASFARSTDSSSSSR